MNNLLWIGSPFFAHSLKNYGWQNVAVHNFEDARIFSWQELVRLAGFEPEVVVVADKSRPPFVLGMENFPCLTVFYSVDAHIHSWQRYYAQGFDLCLVSLADYIPAFARPFLSLEQILWSPPFAADNEPCISGVSKIYDCLFVGSMDAETMPKRTTFLTELKKSMPGLQIMRGNYHTLFPQAQILLNHCEHGDLNFRVFEALGCGGCLLTPKIGNGLSTLFTDVEHLLTYSPNDIEDAKRKIEYLLQNPELAERIRRNGQAEVTQKHLAKHRAQAFTDKIRKLALADAKALIAHRRSQKNAIREQALKMPYLLWANEVAQIEHKKAFMAAALGKFGLSGLDSGQDLEKTSGLDASA